MAGSVHELNNFNKSVKPALIETKSFYSGFKEYLLFLRWGVWLCYGTLVYVIGTRPYRCLHGVNLQKGSYLAAQAQGSFPGDVNIERSCLGHTHTSLICKKKWVLEVFISL